MKKFLLPFVISTYVFCSCESEKLEAPRVPNIPKPTENIEAMYVEDVDISLSSTWWDEANYVNVQLDNVITGEINTEQGVLNVNGTYNGLDDFNKGDSINMTIRSIYNDENIYLLVEWNDNTANTNSKTWFYEGEPDSRKPAEDTTGWTSQKSSDNLYIHFNDIENSKIDVWQWNAALSAPLGYAIDQYKAANGEIINDEGKQLFIRNSTNGTNTSGPQYEWGGKTQDITYLNGKTIAIDPSYYLLDTTHFIGNPEIGSSIFSAECAECHGEHGTGIGPDAYAVNLNSPVFNQYTRQAIIDAGLSNSHDGERHFQRLSESELNNLISYLRGIAGVPGYVLQLPEGSVADVKIDSEFNTFKVSPRNNEKYKILFIRKLQTGNNDDIQLDANKTIKVSIYASDNDEENKIGTEEIILQLMN